MDNVPTDAAGEAMTPLEKRKAMLAEAYSDEIKQFQSCSVYNLVTLFQALTAIDEALCGIVNRPRCSGDAQDIIEDMLERNSDLRGLLIDELRTREITDECRDDELIETVVLYDLAYCGASVMDVLEWGLPRERKLNEIRANKRIEKAMGERRTAGAA